MAGTRSLRRAALLGMTVVVLTVLSGCGGTYQFVQDDRLHFISPKNHSRVNRPVTIQWSISGFTVGKPDGQRSKSSGLFAVFVDRSAVKPGQSLYKIIKKDAACLDKGPTCLDATALADHYVYLTDQTSLTIEQLPRVASSGSIETHTATVILVDGAGYRIGESAWDLNFKVKKRTF